jgi:hypothetical protein
MPKRDPFDLLGVPNNILTREKALARLARTTTRRNVQAGSLIKLAPDVGEMDFRAVDDQGRLRVIMSAFDLFDELGVHAHFAGIDENGVVQFYVNSDNGKLLAGGGAVVLDKDGQFFNDAGDAIVFYDPAFLQYAFISLRTDVGLSYLRLRTAKVTTNTNQISNGDFETGDFTDWTETDPSNKISIISITEGGYAARFEDAHYSTEYIQQSLSATATAGIIVTFRARILNSTGNTPVFVISDAGSDQAFLSGADDSWRNFKCVINGSSTYVRFATGVSGSAGVQIDIDDIVVLPLYSSARGYLDISPVGLNVRALLIRW